ncbi:MAG: TonB-dependent receptor [Lewinellaceae bacterium]|nr:TonB-dependent receptor [Lewinellaceae bacterium]
MRSNIITLLLLALPLFLSAQVDLDITVYEAGANVPLANVPVLLQNPSIGFSAQKNTDARGKISFFGLPIAGNYSVEIAETPVFYGTQKTDIVLRSTTNASVTVPLFRKTDVALDELVVRGASKINVRNAEVSSELRQKEIERLPLEGRDISRILYRLPNVVQATGFYPEAPNVGINGSNSLFTNYLMDGMDNNERFLGGMKFNIPVGFTRNINVLTNNFSTEYGLTGNGIVNITSRSGSNETTGEAFVITRPGAVVDAESPYAQRDLSGNQVRDGFQRYQTGFGLGGALRQDKTFYYLNAEYTRDLKDNLLNSPALGVNETVRGENNFSYFSAKIDHHWSDRFRSSVRANLGVVNIARQGGGLEGGVAFPSADNFQDRNSVLLASQNTYLGDRFKSETNVQYARFRWNYGRAANAGSPNVTVLDPSGVTAAQIGHPGYLFDATENTVQAQQKITLYRDRHTLKAGAEIISAQHGLLGGGNPNGSYTVQLNEAQLAAVQALNKGAALDVRDIPADVQVLAYNVELRPASFGATQNVFSAYLEDAFAATSRLNLTLGLRYDYDNLSKGGGDKGDLDNIAPRFSFNYKLSNNSSLRGGYGIFYDKILYGVYSDALQQNTTDADYKRQLQALKDQGILPAGTDLDKITFDGNIGASANNVTYLQGPSSAELQAGRTRAFSGERRILNPNGYQNPYTHQFSMGFQKQLDDTRLFYVDVMHNESRNLFRLRDLNAPAPYLLDDPANVVVRTQTQADATRPVAIDPGGFAVISGDTVRGVARNVVVSETAGKARYTALSLNFQKDRGADNLAYRLTYTLSKLKNDTEDINFKAMDANNFEREWAPGINDRTHVINGIATYYPWKRLSLTLAALLQSGQPINRIPDAAVFGTTDLNGDGRSFGDAYVGNSDRQPGETRNNDRLPWSNTFDLAGEYEIPTGKRGNLILRADVFNLFNAANLSGYSNNATQSNQVQTGSKASGLLVRRNASAPRQIQFSLRWAF